MEARSAYVRVRSGRGRIGCRIQELVSLARTVVALSARMTFQEVDHGLAQADSSSGTSNDTTTHHCIDHVAFVSVPGARAQSGHVAKVLIRTRERIGGDVGAG